MKLFEPATLGPCQLKNRLIRSGTFEGMADSQGHPLPEYQYLYKQLAAGGVGASLIRFLDIQKVDGIEISYGTMDNALNIFRGEIPLKVVLKHNPVFKTNNGIRGLLHNALIYCLMRAKLKPFTPAYNLEYAKLAKTLTDIPIISVGGFRKGAEMRECIEQGFC